MEKDIKLYRKIRLYWILQIFGWGFFFVTFTSIGVAIYTFHWKILAGYFIGALIGLLLTHFSRYFIKRYNWINLPIKHLALYVIAASIFIGAMWAAISTPVSIYVLHLDELKELQKLGGPQLSIISQILVTIYQFATIIFVWFLLYFSINFFYNFRQSEIEKWKLQAIVREAELQALKSQINPHFIFNSLNNIRSLVMEDPEKARSMITNLSGLLRYSVQFSSKEKVRVEDELEVVENYLKLESIQYEDRLNYKLEINEETLDFKIPPMIIQILVENAIKHGISALPNGGEVNIRTLLEGDDLIVQVLNTGRLKGEVTGTGIGLRNASERLKMLFGKLSTLSIQNYEEDKVMAKFSVPIIV